MCNLLMSCQPKSDSDVIFFYITCLAGKYHDLYRGSYMSAHVLLNLLNELGKRDKMRSLPSILSLFRNEFNKLNDTRVRMLDSIYHMTNTLKSHFWRKKVIIASLCTQRCYGRHNVSRKSINHLWFTDFIAWRYFTPRRDVI